MIPGSFFLGTFFDSTIFLMIPIFIFVFYAQNKVKKTYHKFSRIRTKGNMTGANVARRLLDQAGIHEVSVEMTRGVLDDHYDPRKKVIRLSPEVYNTPSIAALGIAAHETGHAMQDAQGYFFLMFRNNLFPVASLGSRLAMPLFFMGFFFSGVGGTMMDIGIILYFFAVLFQIATLPVELNASSRAVALLEGGGFLQQSEAGGVRQVLNAAALTYVAAMAAALAQLLRMLLIRGRRD